MGKEYTICSEDVHERVQHLIRLFHKGLHEYGVKIDLLFVSTDSEDEEAHALTHGGYPAYAVARVVDSKGRTMGRGDAEIVIDHGKFLSMSSAEKDALLDHELYHFEVQLNKYDKVKLDENRRPKLKLKKHDHQFGWFTEIAKRHGFNAIEVKQAHSIYLEHRQTYFDFTPREAVLVAGLGKGGSVTISSPGTPDIITINRDGSVVKS